MNSCSNVVAVPPLPRSAQRFHSDDVDEVREFAARFSGPHSRVVRGSGRLRFSQTRLAGAAAMAGWVSIGLAMAVRGAVREPVVHLGQPAGTEYLYRQAFGGSPSQSLRRSRRQPLAQGSA